MPIYQEQFSLVYVRITCSIWYFIQFVRIVKFMSLHIPAGACIPVASVSPIHVPPVQHILKHCGAHKHINIHTHVIQNNLRTSQLASFACQLGCKNMATTLKMKVLYQHLLWCQICANVTPGVLLAPQGVTPAL